MSCKFKIVGPLCMAFVVLLIVSYFGMTSWAVADSTGSEDLVTVAVEPLSAENVNAPATVKETLKPQDVVIEKDENPDEAVEPASKGTSGYELTEAERMAVECAVMCEAGGEGPEGQMMVAQSILDGTLRNDYDVFDTIYKYQIHSTSYSNVTDEVRESVSRVFDDGQRVTEEKTDLWYNPALVESAWHEQQQYVTTVGSHRFFWMNKDMDT